MKKIYKLIIVLVVLLGVLAVAVVVNGTGGNQETKLNTKLKDIGTEFYEDFYYDQIVSGKTEEEVVEFLSRFSEIGIKVNLDNLSRFSEGKYSDLSNEFTNKKSKVACDINNTRALIFPKEPYGKKDHEVNAELDCGFEK